MKFRSLQEVGSVLGLSAPDTPFSHVTFDSRAAGSGALFFALSGKKIDGHSFLETVAEKGGVGAVVSEGYKGESFGLTLFKVPDVVQALQELAAHLHSRRGQKVIAITGSVGKTTTKEFIAHLLGGEERVMKTPGNANSQVGLPTFLLNAEGGQEVAVLEMGMSREGELRRLVNLAPPDIAVLTRVGEAHTGAFEDGVQGVIREKSEILAHPRTKLAFIEKKTFELEGVRTKGRCEKRGCGVECLEGLQTPFHEAHLLENLALAVSVAEELGVSREEIERRLLTLEGAERRFEKLSRQGALIVNDCYNASPESIRAAFEGLPKPQAGGKTVAVLGAIVSDHFPVGGVEAGHKEVARFALGKAERFFLYGEATLAMQEVLGNTARYFTDKAALKEALWSEVAEGDVVLIKGSRGNELWELI